MAKHRMRARRTRVERLMNRLLGMQWFPVAVVGAHGYWLYEPPQVTA